MRDFTSEAIEIASRHSQSDLGTNRLLVLGLSRLVEMTGEAASRVSDGTTARYPQIPWREVIGMRHRIVHGYDNIDLSILWATIVDDLPPLLHQLEKILEEMENS